MQHILKIRLEHIFAIFKLKRTVKNDFKIAPVAIILLQGCVKF